MEGSFMPIIVQNLRMENCDIAVDVGDTANQGTNGTLEIYVSGNKTCSKTVSLFNKLTTVLCPAERDGNNHNVEAILTTSDETDKDTAVLRFCSEKSTNGESTKNEVA